MKRLTLNLGIRYDRNQSIYLGNGLTNRFYQDGVGLYGVGRPAGNITTDSQLLANWLRASDVQCNLPDRLWLEPHRAPGLSGWGGESEWHSHFELRSKPENDGGIRWTGIRKSARHPCAG